MFDTSAVEIPHYANTANNKAGLSRYAHKLNLLSGTMRAGRLALFWRSNASITQVTFLTDSGNLVAGSRVTLYGWP